MQTCCSPPVPARSTLSHGPPSPLLLPVPAAGGAAQEYTSYELHFAASTVALACCMLALLCLALSRCCGPEEEGCDCEECCEAAGHDGSSTAFIKAAGYTKL